MKKVEAIIRKTKFEAVKKALHEAGIDFFSFWDARGVGQAREERVYRGVAYDTSSIERLYISIYVREKYLKATVDAILNSAATGEIGDGKIFVSTIDEAYRIRTKSEGESSLFVGEE